MPRSPRRIPKYRHHRSTGRAVVTLNGRDIYLGEYGSSESHALYARLIAEWTAGGGNMPVKANDISVTEIIAQFWGHAEQIYSHSELANFRTALRPLKTLYGDLPAGEFGPRSLRAVRQKMVEKGWTRANINKQVGRLKHVFKWAVSQELIPPSVYHGLLAVEGLRRGRTEARETEPIRPVPQKLVDAVLPLVSRQVGAMIRLQLLTGARAGEFCIARGCDLDRSGRIWIYRPEHHKTAHHGHERQIWIGPKAQKVLRPFLKDRDPQVHLFSPAEAEAERRDAMRQERKTPIQPSQVARAAKAARRRRRRSPGDHYDVGAYRRAIQRACQAAFPPPKHLRRYTGESHKVYRARLTDQQKEELKAWWKTHRWHPHQLRHNAGTFLRKEYGIEVARLILGHRSAAITEVYAEMDQEKAVKIMAEVG